MYHLIKELENEKSISLQLVVTGMHLSKEYGNSWKTIEKDGFHIDKKVETLTNGDTPVDICESIAKGVNKFAKVFEQLKPDLVLILGDRYEIFAVAQAACISRIPIAHLHGGETTQGAIDEPIRHSITKMSHLHFAGTHEYAKRIIQLGENPKRVFNVGATGVDNIVNLKLFSKEEFEKSIDFKLNKRNLIVTFHPATFEKNTAEKQFCELLDFVDELENTNIIFTGSNSDTDGKIINKLINNYVSKNPKKATFFVSLGQLRYLSALQYVDAMVGNSSSGLTEAPSFKIATINIGDRQKGRTKAKNVINCEPKKAEIKKAYDKSLTKEFQEELKKVKNPYGSGGASKKIVEIIKKTNIDNILKKSFYDLTFEL
jgi:GDP/UDP-N,N'-diacetylbacillosamine 2-epimerase (hydrolysing)